MLCYDATRTQYKVELSTCAVVHACTVPAILTARNSYSACAITLSNHADAACARNARVELDSCSRVSGICVSVSLCRREGRASILQVESHARHAGEAWRRSIGGLDRSCGLSPPNVAPHDDLVVPLTAASLKVVQHVVQITRTERAVTSLRATPPRVVATISRCCAPRHA